MNMPLNTPNVNGERPPQPSGLSFYGGSGPTASVSQPQTLGPVSSSLNPSPQAPAPAPMNPQAGQLQDQGRGQDSQLVHMTPDEVNSLKGLAQRFGGNLTTNPQTGLPEAGWLGKLLPTILGIGASFIPGVGPLMAAGIVGAGQTALTGDLGKGLTAGLQAFGGASLGGALGAGGAGAGASAAGAAPPIPAANLASPAAQTAASQAATAPIAANVAQQGALNELMANPALSGMQGVQAAAPMSIGGAGGAGGLGALPGAPPVSSITPAGGFQFQSPVPAPTPLNVAGAAPPIDPSQLAQAGAGPLPSTPLTAPKSGLGGFLDKFKTASRDLPGSGPGMNPAKLPGKIAPWAAGAGLLSGLSDATTPEYKGPQEEKSNYEQMKAAPRKSIFDKGEGGGDDYNTLSPLSSLGVQPAAGGLGGTPPAQATVNGMGGGAPPVADRAPFDSSERTFFDEINPNPRVVPFNAKSAGSTTDTAAKKKKKFLGIFADGGSVSPGVFHMETGGHVFPAFDVATFGHGSSDAGMAKLAKLGGIPIKGKGDGVSDSIPAMIDGKQKARVANGEVYFPARAVEKAGGTKKLYAMMHAAEKARKKTPSGSKVKGLA